MNIELLRMEIASLYDGLDDVAPRLLEFADEARSARERQALTGSAELAVELARRLRYVLRFVDHRPGRDDDPEAA